MSIYSELLIKKLDDAVAGYKDRNKDYIYTTIPYCQYRIIDKEEVIEDISGECLQGFYDCIEAAFSENELEMLGYPEFDYDAKLWSDCGMDKHTLDRIIFE